MTAKLTMTVGLPQSGKSTWARKQGCPIVNPDSIRLALHGQAFIPQAEKMVWAIAGYMVDALFLAGHEQVIIDATNVTEKRRAEWTNHKYPVPVEVVARMFFESPTVCIDRALSNGRPDLVPVIQRMQQEWDNPRPEGW